MPVSITHERMSETQVMQKKTSVKINLIHLCIIILFFFSWEMVLSWYVEKNTFESPFEIDPLLLWKNRPGKFNHNSLGLRGAEIDPSKKQGELRILILGDSSIYGDGVSPEETMARHLETIFSNNNPGMAVTVANGGVCGYSSCQGKYFFRELIPAVKPDIVVIGYFHSDVKKERQEDLGIIHQNALTGLRRVLFKSTLYLTLRKEIGLAKFYLWGRKERRQGSSSACNRVSTTDYGENLRDIIELSRKNGAKTLLIRMQHPANVYPSSPWWQDAEKYLQVHEEVATETESPIVDIWNLFSMYPPGEVYTNDLLHPSSYGHYIIAQEIYNCLIKNNMLEAR